MSVCVQLSCYILGLWVHIDQISMWWRRRRCICLFADAFWTHRGRFNKRTKHFVCQLNAASLMLTPHWYRMWRARGRLMIQESKDQLHRPVLPLFCTASLSFMHAESHRCELLEHLCNAAAVQRAYFEVLCSWSGRKVSNRSANISELQVQLLHWRWKHKHWCEITSL